MTTLPTHEDGRIDWGAFRYPKGYVNWLDPEGFVVTVPIEALGPLVAAHTIERCAKVADEWIGQDLLADAIRRLES